MSNTPRPAAQVAVPQPAAPKSVDLRVVLDLILNLQRSLDLNEVANVAVNDGRLLWGVDRVSLALRRGRKTVVVAVSGQETVHPRGNLVRMMSTLCHKVVTSGEALKYDGSPNALPPPLEKPVAEFIHEAGARFLLIVPLLEPSPLVPSESPSAVKNAKLKEAKVIGALVIEQMANSQPSVQLQMTIDIVIDHISAAVSNARTYGAIFLLPVWRSLGRFFQWLQGWRLAVATVILGLLAGSGAALVLIPWEYSVDGTGRLMPVVQREVFAPWDGQVLELLVAGGERVEADQVLVTLRNDELAAEIVTVENKLHEKRKLLLSLQAQHEVAEKQGNREEAVKLQGRSVETSVELDGANNQLKVLYDRRDRLTVRAPIAGVVTTFQVDQLLLNRPVKRGDVLLQVMDDTGEWHLELEIAEQRVGRILRAQQQQQGNDEPEPLPIKFCLLTQPEANYSAKLKELGTRTVTAETNGSVLEATAQIDQSMLPARSIGAEVRARIGCGKSSLGDVLFGDVVEFVQKYLWW